MVVGTKSRVGATPGASSTSQEKGVLGYFSLTLVLVPLSVHFAAVS